MSSLPKTSIIVCYFNESPSVLIRMVNSIIDRTPLELIQEILLIDDSSEWPDASLQAADYQKKHPQWNMVKFLRTPSNQGLIRAKVFGARKARGEVLVFLDSHCEVNQEWLQPLLERIKEKPERVVCPIIDIIDLDSMKYVESPVCKADASLQAADYQKKHPQWNMVKFLRTPSNQGLIRAKVFGARKARGEVLVFLDSHCEVNQEWLQPLLERIKEKPERVVCPIIDIIDLDSMKYVESPVCKGGLNWGLTFKWDYPPHIYFLDPENFIRPLKSATMAGGLFAVNRNYFFKIGTYDEGMDVWGAENVEISFRTEFFKARPYLATKMDYGDISDRIQLRKNLHCKSFKWYLENIYPELLPNNIPEKHEIVEKPAQFGKKYQIRLANTTFCLSAESSQGRISRGARVEMRVCHGKREQQWRWNENVSIAFTILLSTGF
ncbi:unnamed protein product [Strongylus vulgaris]|uniref:Polypeptide N-acetylgalactosaminyltransferase n=1 Tax=Strongylus vulgaris TaxID=40348 RepID=A0A3P7L8H2_STRVU|nr:unnamed protein product [Strongylus vulgaris]